jgi:3',5'-cyclic AMP phosphodiesterase CpdA
MATMRIAHISDLHVLAMDGVPAGRFFNKRFTGYVNLKLKRQHVHRSHTVVALLREIRRQNPEHVVITGDLTNLALEPEFEAVREMLEQELGFDPSRVSVVPGNHDLYTRGAQRDQRFTRYFAPYVTSDLPLLAANIPLGPYPFVRLRENVAIIGLSSAVPRLPLVAAGELGALQSAALREILANEEVKKRTPVFLLHHPPRNPDSVVKTALEGLWDAAALTSMSNHLARGLLLHGHLHRRIHRSHITLGGTLDSVGATSASLHHEHADRMAGFNTYDIDRSGAIEKISSCVYDPEHGTFSVRAVPEAPGASAAS